MSITVIYSNDIERKIAKDMSMLEKAMREACKVKVRSIRTKGYTS